MKKRIKKAKENEEKFSVEGTFQELVRLSVTGLEKPAAKPAPKKAVVKKVEKKK
jgi:hypothetical protein